MSARSASGPRRARGRLRLVRQHRELAAFSLRRHQPPSLRPAASPAPESTGSPQPPDRTYGRSPATGRHGRASLTRWVEGPHAPTARLTRRNRPVVANPPRRGRSMHWLQREPSRAYGAPPRAGVSPRPGARAVLATETSAASRAPSGRTYTSATVIARSAGGGSPVFCRELCDLRLRRARWRGQGGENVVEVDASR
jgi:hypothetical protein